MFKGEHFVPENEYRMENDDEKIKPYEVGLPGDQVTVADDANRDQLKVPHHQEDLPTIEKTEYELRALLKEYSDEIKTVDGANITDEKLHDCDQHFLITTSVAENLPARLTALEYSIEEIEGQGFIAQYGEEKIAFVLSAEKADDTN